MLYGQSKQYLLEKLVAAGLKSRPYTALKALRKAKSPTSVQFCLNGKPTPETAPKSDLGMKRERNTNGARFLTGLSPSLYS